VESEPGKFCRFIIDLPNAALEAEIHS